MIDRAGELQAKRPCHEPLLSVGCRIARPDPTA
jgi:hypothetical protein